LSFFDYSTSSLARSSEFRKLFIENANESKLPIADISKEAFNELLRFLYCGNIENLAGIALELLKVADRFGVSSLKKICESQLFVELAQENASEVFQLAHRLSAESLKRAAFGIVQQ
jgi:transcriptional regulator with PAS, ATPase and Fis domain